MDKQRNKNHSNIPEIDINVSAKALRMKRYRGKLKNERNEKYDEMKRKDAERKNT